MAFSPPAMSRAADGNWRAAQPSGQHTMTAPPGAVEVGKPFV
jgi:hypothetical protein